MLNILVDSTSDLGADLVSQYKLHVIPLYVAMKGQYYKDGNGMTIHDLFQSVSETGQLPKTSAPTVPDFLHFFEQPGEWLYLSLSGRLSATLQNALLASQSCEPGRITIIDSLNLSSGIGLIAIKAAELRDQGLSAAEIERQIRGLVPNIRTSFMIETLDYLYKGGRCSAMQNLVGGLLAIRPIIAVRQDGTLGVKAKTRGTRKKGLQVMLDDFRDNLPQIDLSRVFVTHAGCVADAEYLRSELMKLAPIQEIHSPYIGSVIATHCGPDTIGISYLMN